MTYLQEEMLKEKDCVRLGIQFFKWEIHFDPSLSKTSNSETFYPLLFKWKSGIKEYSKVIPPILKIKLIGAIFKKEVVTYDETAMVDEAEKHIAESIKYEKELNEAFT